VTEHLPPPLPLQGIEWQKMENPDLRKALGMKATQKGVLIRRVEPTAPCASQMARGDILLAFDGVDIACDGTVPFRHGERIGFRCARASRVWDGGFRF